MKKLNLLPFALLWFAGLAHCSPAHTPGIQSDGSIDRPLTISGSTLYSVNCAGCHGALINSSKKSRTAAQITNAINTISYMASLKILSQPEIIAIADALNPAPLAPPTTIADEYFFKNHPQLYALGRRYFPAEDTVKPAKRIFRLTRAQIDATVKSLLARYFPGSISDSVAKDPLQTNYEYADTINVNSANFTPLMEWIGKIAAAVRANPTGVINCAGNTVPCLQTEARTFITKAFRGDVDAAKINQIVKFYTDSVIGVGFSEATGDLVDVVLSSPQFLYRHEFLTDATGVIAASELLENVSYTLGDAPAEQFKFSSLDPVKYVETPAALRATIQTVMSAPESRDKLLRFFVKWLEVKDPGEFTISAVEFPQFNAPLIEGILRETQLFLNNALGKTAPKLKDVTQSSVSFVPKSMADLYDLNPNVIVDEGPISLDPNKRLGIFSQPSVIASHSGPATTRPMKRGVFWLRKVMCMDMEPPPKGVDTTIPDTVKGSERQKIETVTNQAACMGCHTAINPFGFFHSNFDTIGKWRTLDDGYPVDSSLSTNILDEGPLRTTTPVEALRGLTGSAMFKQCFVRQMFRFYMGRTEETSDHPLLREMFYYFANNDEQDLLSLLVTLGNHPRFKQRQGP